MLELRDEALRKIAYLPAYARVGRSETRSRQQLEKIIEFLALSERVQKHRHGAQVESHGAETQQVRGDTRRFATNSANGFPARGDVPVHQFLDRQRVSHVIRKRRKVIEPIGVRDELVILHVLGDLFITTM